MLEGEGSAFCDHRVNVMGWECEYVGRVVEVLNI